jgi:pilus assembly protein Flp/PilA
MELLIAHQLKLRTLLAKSVEREEGQDMIEYALLAALIAIATIAVLVLVGPELRKLFQDVINGLQNT